VKPTIRTATAADCDAVASVIESWRGGLVLGTLPRLLLDSLRADGRSINGPVPSRNRLGCGILVFELAR
jgi:hypothetical protein